MEETPKISTGALKFFYFDSYKKEVREEEDRATHIQSKPIITIPPSDSLRKPLNTDAIGTYVDFLVRKVTEEHNTWVKIRPGKAQEIFRKRYPQFRNEPLPIDLGPLIVQDGVEPTLVTAPFIAETVDGARVYGLSLFSYDRGRKDTLWIMESYKDKGENVEAVVYHQPYETGEGFTIKYVRSLNGNVSFVEKKGDPTNIKDRLTVEQLLNLARSSQKVPDLLLKESEGVLKREKLRSERKEDRQPDAPKPENSRGRGRGRGRGRFRKRQNHRQRRENKHGVSLDDLESDRGDDDGDRPRRGRRR